MSDYLVITIFISNVQYIKLDNDYLLRLWDNLYFKHNCHCLPPISVGNCTAAHKTIVLNWTGKATRLILEELQPYYSFSFQNYFRLFL